MRKFYFLLFVALFATTKTFSQIPEYCLDNEKVHAYLTRGTYPDNDYNIRDYKAAVEAITAETVQATLKELVKAGNMFEVVMFPEN